MSAQNNPAGAPAGSTTPPSMGERFKNFFKENGFIVLILVAVTAVACAVPYLKNFLTKESLGRAVKAADLESQIRGERDELRIKTLRQNLEMYVLTNEIIELRRGLDLIVDSTVRMNQQRSNSTLSPSASILQTNPPPSQPTSQAVTPTESSQRFGTGFVTVNGDNTRVKVIYMKGDDERSERTSDGPDKGEEIIPGLAKPDDATEPIDRIWMIPSKGNGIRFYRPNGWSLSYIYYCSADDFDVYINKGTREVPIWTLIDVSSDGRSDSIWIRNRSRRNIKFKFTLTPVKK